MRWEERERCGSRDLFGWEKIDAHRGSSWCISEVVLVRLWCWCGVVDVWVLGDYRSTTMMAWFGDVRGCDCVGERTDGGYGCWCGCSKNLEISRCSNFLFVIEDVFVFEFDEELICIRKQSRDFFCQFFLPI